LSQVKELYISKDDILKSESVYKLCFTDTSIILAAKGSHGYVVTADYKLYSFCRKFKVGAFRLREDILDIGAMLNS
jgi:hypothetical protein